MLKKILIVLFLSSLLIPAQSINSIYKKIENKIKEDKTYLNLYSVDFSPVKAKDIQYLPIIPKLNGGKVSFDVNNKINLKYLFIVMLPNIDFEKTTILLVKKQITPENLGTNILGGVNASPDENNNNPAIIEEEFLSFSDIQNLYYNYPDKYNVLLSMVDSLQDISAPTKLLKIKVDEEIRKSKGISAKDNLDFLNYNLVNNFDYYPSLKKDMTSNSTFGGRLKNSNSGMKISGELSRITFFDPKHMKWKNNFVSLSLTTESQLLNISAYEGMVISPGFRTLVFLGSQGNLQNSFIFDVKFSGRIRMNTRNLVKSLPFVFTGAPKLNIGGGVDINLSLTRPFGLPFLNFYFASSIQNVDNPYSKFKNSNGNSIAYFNFGRFSSTMSFYWNNNESRTLRLKLDIGVGRHDIYRVDYKKDETIKKLEKNSISPLIEFNLTLLPGGTELLSTSIRYYESRIKFKVWMQLLKFSNSTIRLAVSYIGQPIYRRTYPWENSTSGQFGIIYRYGF